MKLTRTLAANARGALAAAGIALVTLGGFVPLLPVAVAKRVLPDGRARRAVGRAAIAIAIHWARIVNGLVLAISRTRVAYTQRLPDAPNNGCFALVSNHQCAADAMFLVHVLDGRLPFPRICLKRSLRWLPVIGLAFGALDYVFVSRYSRAELAAHPERRGEDAAAIEQACAVFRHAPATLVNYVEGTRSTAAKRAVAGAPYRALLPPKAGGFALTLQGLGDRLDGVLDVTIAYVDTPAPSLWKLLCGRIPAVSIRLRQVTLPAGVARGDYSVDPAYRERVKRYLEALWADKDPEVAAIADPSSPQCAFS